MINSGIKQNNAVLFKDFLYSVFSEIIMSNQYPLT